MFVVTNCEQLLCLLKKIKTNCEQNQTSGLKIRRLFLEIS